MFACLGVSDDAERAELICDGRYRFSGVCSSQVPSYITSYSDFKAKGVNNVYVVAVNDIFVVNAWKDKMLGELGSGKREGVKFGKSNSPTGVVLCSIFFLKKMLLAADDTAALASALGLTFDAQPVFGGPRLKRGVLVVNDGVVEYVGVEDSPGDSASPSLFFFPLHALS